VALRLSPSSAGPGQAAQFLAFDLGAQSGRAILGRLASGVLEVTEIRRFANEPSRTAHSLRWNTSALWSEIRASLDAAAPVRLESVGIDSWGVDYALIGDRGELLEHPYHYRDQRTKGALEELIALVGRARLYEITGIQFHAINTLVQLHAACRATPDVIGAARTLLTIADYFNYCLTGRACTEYTIASTTQCLDARTRAWAADLLTEVGIPSRLFAPIVAPGTVIGPIAGDDQIAQAGTPVIATACHDTASAFASVRSDAGTAFLSSGTWSLFGAELPAPILSASARDANFTNEGGAGGTIRFLKNISGLWLLEACRRSWGAGGRRDRYEELLAAAADAPAFHALVDPDHDVFLNPDDMPTAIDRYCRRTEQPAPREPAAYTRAVLESLAYKYRVVLESLESLTGVCVEEIRVVGGGSRNRLLNQFTADATGRRVVAGPVEATALGNIAVQMLATGAVGSLADARAIIERSFPVERYDPIAHDRWDAEYGRFKDYVEAGRG
jgi:rhamnulokinase